MGEETAACLPIHELCSFCAPELFSLSVKSNSVSLEEQRAGGSDLLCRTGCILLVPTSLCGSKSGCIGLGEEGSEAGGEGEEGRWVCERGGGCWILTRLRKGLMSSQLLMEIWI
eukprot:1615627-Rhodomonas_salina.4